MFCGSMRCFNSKAAACVNVTMQSSSGVAPSSSSHMTRSTSVLVLPLPALLGTSVTGAVLCAASIYFGGGTPSLLQPYQLARLLEGIAATVEIRSDAEITLEANPGTVDLISLKAFLDAGDAAAASEIAYIVASKIIARHRKESHAKNNQ